MGTLNVTTTDMVSLAVWAVFLGIVVYWANTFRTKVRDIIGNRKWYYIFSSCILVFCLVGIFGKGLNLGLDFTGGTILEVGAPKVVSLTSTQICDVVKKDHPGFDVTAQLGDGLITSGEGKQYQKILVRVRSDASTKEMGLSSEQAVQVRAELEKAFNVGPLENISETTIGPTVSSELKSGAFKAMAIACILQLIYITFRFGNQLRFGAAGVLGVVHDAIVMIGFYAWAGMPVDSNFIAAVLTIISYSLMDSVVVFDRIREHQRNGEEGTFADLTNKSLCETMTRSINTSLTTVVVCICLYFMGGESLQSFAYALMVGVIAGSYSSIYIASPLVVDFEAYAVKRDAKRADEMRREAEEKAREERDIKAARRNGGRRPQVQRDADLGIQGPSAADVATANGEKESAAHSAGSVPAASSGDSAPAGYVPARPRRRVKGMRKQH